MTAENELSNSSPQNMSELVAALASRGDATAVIDFRVTETLCISYRELAGRAGRFRNHFVEVGPKNNRIILLAPPSPDCIAAVLGAFYANICVVSLDTQLPDDVLRHTIEDCDGTHVVTTTALADRVKKLFPNNTLTYLYLDTAQSPNPGVTPDNVQDSRTVGTQIEQSAVAALFYTSGTTAMPKGVPLTHGNLLFEVQAIRDGKLLDAQSRVLLPLPIHHVYPFVLGLLTPLALGATVVLPQAMTGPQLIRALVGAQVTHLLGVPRLYEALLSAIHNELKNHGRLVSLALKGLLALSRQLRLRTGLYTGRLLLWPLHRRIGPDLRILASGGAPIPEVVVNELEAIGWQVAIGYGLTETSPLITLRVPGKRGRGSVGQAVAGMEIRIVPVETVSAPMGEVQVHGPGVFHGYHKLAAKTAEAFTEDDWFRTGDLGWLDDDGYLFLGGRLSTLIVTPGGENVQPDQLEECYSQHPAIKEIGILQHGKGLAAVVVPNLDEGKTTNGDAVAQAVRDALHQSGEKLASYQQVSRFVITHEKLDRTRIGKIKRPQLKALFNALSTSAEREAAAVAASRGTSKTPSDAVLMAQQAPAQVWSWLVKTYPNVRLSPNTELKLELGIDSLDWLEITHSVRQLTGIELDETVINRLRTVRDLLTTVAHSAQQAETGDFPEKLFGESEIEPRENRIEQLTAVSKPAVLAYWFIFQINRLLMKTLFRVRAKGLDNLDGNPPFIIAPNHISYLDSFALAAILTFGQARGTCWAGWTGVVSATAWRRACSNLAQVIAVDPNRPASSLANAAAALRRRKALVWYPEGRRSPDGELHPFKPGIGMLLQELDVPVIPVYIRGSDQALPPGARWIHLHRIDISVGKPLRRDELMLRGTGTSPQGRITSGLFNAIKELQPERQPPP